uniref:Uncharacterized protein n=1 Tax=Anguilla anguilla TaxID=7936 RepID=A0A0E9UD39_ANGAN
MAGKVVKFLVKVCSFKQVARCKQHFVPHCG